ncbi:MAG: FAD-dependent oxidoreductase [Oscillospiraceae bacterium]|nr:FAD-dependent oxidoreductase [Oscillospiraceae bacterium]
MNSIWSESVKINGFDKLKENIKTDVLIIGGGIAGILCAYFLNESGVDYILAEGKNIGGGITKNTTAKITSQHGLLYDKLLKKLGYDKAKAYLDSNQLALSKFIELSKTYSCDFEEKSAFVYSLSDRKVIEKEVAAVNKLGFNAEFAGDISLPFDIAGAVKFENQAQFNPMKFIEGISKSLNIYENTFVRELGKNTAITDTAEIKAEHIIIASHFPFLNKHGGYFLKMYQHRSYVIALENAANIDGMYLQETKNGMSFRNYKGFLLIGGGDHRTGKQGGNWNVLREFAKKHYPNSTEKYAWAAQDCMSLDNIPYIGRYSKSTPNLYVATGFNKWGMTGSMVSAMLLTDMIAGRNSPYAEIFSPSRGMLKPQLLLNGITAAANLLSFSTKRCPHMGCALKWNKTERTWDCPCHGSRFEKDGTLIDNPATGGLKS